jgi:uncharacterized protein (DUF1501 family)
MKRRDFISQSAWGLLAPMISPSFVNNNHAQNLFENVLSTSDKANDHVLVLIQMVGGNDGLNMVFPMETYGNLWASRLSVVVHSPHLLSSKKSDLVSFHPSMAGVRDLFDENKVRIINSVGYPEQNFSHFRSSDIWLTGSAANENITTGWAGRYLSKEFTNFPTGYPNAEFPHPAAIVTNSATSVIMQDSANLGFVVTELDTDYAIKTNAPKFTVSGKAAKELDFLRVQSAISNGYTNEIYKMASKVSQQKPYPNTNLGLQLKNIARMIASGLKTKVYLATISGFDTHANQVIKDNQHTGHHANLLAELSGGIKAFMDDLKFLGIDRRVMGLTFSEFGRRVGSNGSLGTDHGAAAPMLAFGTQVIGGIQGQNPEIEKYASQYTNLPMLYDFRSVFSSVLKDWFCVEKTVLEQVFFKNFQHIPIVNNFDCTGITAVEPPNTTPPPVTEPPTTPPVVVVDPDVTKITSGEKTLKEGAQVKAYPNPMHNKLNIEFETKGGYCRIQLFNNLGQLVQTVNEGTLWAGFYKQSVDVSHYSDGQYFLRFQNKNEAKTLNLRKLSN